MNLRVITCNVNGVRSAAKKGFFAWAREQQPDVLCLQELKAHDHQLPAEAELPGMERHLACAERAGYAGVALYLRSAPKAVHIGFGALDPEQDWREFDAEGRFILADFERFSVASVYVPSGSSSPERQAAKMVFLERFLPLMRRLRESRPELIVCGDINIAHRRIDLKNWRGNQKNSGFLPEERAWFGRWLETGFVDVFRALHPEQEAYSWWSNRGRAREKDVGWRIDYHVCTPGIAGAARAASIHDRNDRFSDHAPLIADFDLPGD
ncbi:MAG: exodeoxyribonuclease III [Mariprofundaceae bacterium]